MIAAYRQECLAFGRELLRTNDLDPLYVLLYLTPMPTETLERYILAYSMFYHAGVAARIATAKDFWAEVRRGIDEKWPRGTERRHWRGAIAEGTYKAMSHTDTPHLIVRFWYAKPTFTYVFEAVQRWSGYGPWIAFKVADLIDRTGLERIDFSGANLAIYRDPVMGAALYTTGSVDARIAKETVTEVLTEISYNLREFKAPPLYDRPVGVTEAETCLCKFKSHYNGHYPIGKDSREILHALEGWGPLAEEMRKCPLVG